MPGGFLYFKNVVVNGALSIQDGGTAPTAGITTTGWTVAKIASGNFSLMAANTEKTAFSTTDALATPAFSAASCWRSESPYTGTFDNANWTLSFRVRAVSAAASQQGRVKVRLWKSASADGTGAVQLTSAPLTSAIASSITTSASANCSITWTAPGAQAFDNEYFWVQCEWEITLASGNNAGDVLFYIESTARITPPTFVVQPAYAQVHFRFRTDTGDVDATPTWAEAEDVSIPAAHYANVNYRLRISVQNTGAGSPINNWTLRYSKNGGAYTAITTTSSVVQAVDAGVNNSGDVVTVQRLTSATGTFISGLYEERGTTDNASLPSGRFTEFEYGIRVVAADVANNDTIDFQVWPNTTGAITQTVTPRITVAVSAGVTGTGALAASASAVSGTGTSASAGTGAPAARAATIAGTGVSSSVGIGALVAAAAALAGSGTVAAAAITGTGALVPGSAALAGAGVSASTGTGTLTAATATAAGAGASASVGAGVLAASAAALTGPGASSSVGTGSLVGGAAAVAGSGAAALPTITGTGALVAGAATVAGAGTSASLGAGTLAAAAAIVAGVGASASVGSGALVAGAAEMAGSGAVLAAGDAVAPGAILPLTLALLAGAASGEGVQPPVVIIGRPLRFDAIAPGAVLPLWLELVAGGVAADAMPRGVVLPLVRTTVVAGQATGEGQTDYDNDLVLLLAA